MAVTTKRIHDLAKQYKVSSHALLKIAQDLGFDIKSHMSVATPEVVNAVSLKFAQERQKAKAEMEVKRKATREAERTKAEAEAKAKANRLAAEKEKKSVSALARIDGLTRGKLIKAAPKVPDPPVKTAPKTAAKPAGKSATPKDNSKNPTDGYNDFSN